jgi:hypothetical protein
MTDQPRRVRIVSPRTGATRAGVRRAIRHDIDEQTGVGEVYMRSLVRTQLRLALGVCLVFAGLLGAIPLMFEFAPWVDRSDVLGIPLPWLLLGGLLYPVLVVGGWIYVRAAERNEAEFADLVDRS